MGNWVLAKLCNQCCHSVMKKKPNIYLKKKQKIIKRWCLGYFPAKITLVVQTVAYKLTPTLLTLEVQTVQLLLQAIHPLYFHEAEKKLPLRWRCKQLLSKSTPTLVAQIWFLNQHPTLEIQCKQLLSKSTPTLVVQILNSCFLNQHPTLEIQCKLAFWINPTLVVQITNNCF